MKPIFIEESKSEDVATMYTDVVFRIFGERKKDSLEIPMWEKRLKISDTVIETAKEGEFLITEMRMENATEVFKKFYFDNFINPPKDN